jgi:predicted nuclease with TOPRIM domain
VKNKPHNLGLLRHLLESYERAEAQAFETRRVAAQEVSNELKRLEYQRRREAMLQRQSSPEKLAELKQVNETLKAAVTRIESENETLKGQVARLQSDNSTLTLRLKDARDDIELYKTQLKNRQSSSSDDDDIKKIRSEVRSKTLTALRERKVALDAEWKRLIECPLGQDKVNRMQQIALEQKVIAGFESTKAGEHAA